MSQYPIFATIIKYGRFIFGGFVLLGLWFAYDWAHDRGEREGYKDGYDKCMESRVGPSPRPQTWMRDHR